MAHGDFAIMSKRTGDAVAGGSSLEGALAEFESRDHGLDLGFVVVEYHKYREVPLFECADADEAERKIREKIGEQPVWARR